MTKRLKTILIVVVVFIFLVGYVVQKYNRMAVMDEGIKTAWSQVDVQLQRRFELIPNLVETVKGYAAHEKDLFIQVTNARSKVGGANTIDDKITSNNELTSAISRLLLVVERYPELKANENFIRLQDELAGTENRISVERRRYNDTVRVFNQYIRRFPQGIFARLFSFKVASYFEAPDAAATAPNVKF